MENEPKSPRLSLNGGIGGGERKDNSENSALPAANHHPSRPHHASGSENAAAFRYGPAADNADPRAAAIAAAQVRAMQHHLHNQHQMMQQQQAAAAVAASAAAYHPAMAAAFGGGRPAHHAMMVEDLNAWKILVAQQQQQKARQASAAAVSEKGPLPHDHRMKGRKSNVPPTTDFSDISPEQQQQLLQYQESLLRKQAQDDAEDDKGRVEAPEGKGRKVSPATTREQLPGDKTKTTSSKAKPKHSKTNTNRDNRITGPIIEQAALDAAASIAQRGGMINVETDVALPEDITVAKAASLNRKPPPPPPPPPQVIVHHPQPMIHPYIAPPPPAHLSPHLAPPSPHQAINSTAAVISKLTQAAQTASTSLVQAISALQTIGQSLSVLAPSNLALFSSLPQQPLLLNIHLLDFDSIKNGENNDKDDLSAPSFYLPFDPENDKNKSVAEYTRGIVEDHMISDYLYKLISSITEDHKGDNGDTRFYYGAGYTSRFKIMSSTASASSGVDQSEKRTSLTLSILPPEFSEGSNPKNVNIADLSALAPDSLLLHHLQAYSISEPFMNNPSNHKVIQIGIHTKGPNWGVSSSSSVSTHRDKIRVWNIWYDSIKQNIVRRMERDKPGEEYDRKILQYIVSVEIEGEEARKRKREAQQQQNQQQKLQQVLAPDEGFEPVVQHAAKAPPQPVQHAKASPQPTNLPQQELQANAAAIPLPGLETASKDLKPEQVCNYQKFKRDLSMTPGAIRARKRRAAIKEDKDKRRKLEQEEKLSDQSSSDISAAVAAASVPLKKKQNGPMQGKEIKTTPSPSQLEQQHKRMAEILVNATTTATAAPSLAGERFMAPRPTPAKTNTTSPPLKTPPKSLIVTKTPSPSKVDKTSTAVLTKTAPTSPPKGKKRRGRPPKNRSNEAAGGKAKAPSKDIPNNTVDVRQGDVPSNKQLPQQKQVPQQRQVPQSKEFSATSTASATVAKGKNNNFFQSSSNDSASMPSSSATTNVKASATKDTFNDGSIVKKEGSSININDDSIVKKESSSTKLIQKSGGKTAESTSITDKAKEVKENNEKTSKESKQQKNSSVGNNVKINRHDNWNTVYSKLMDLGWTVISGTGLADFFYVHPSFSGRKRKEIVKVGLLGTDYMDNENDLKMYCRKHYGWFGELPGGISSSDFDVGLYQSGGTIVLADGSGSSIGDGTWSHGGEEISSIGESGDVAPGKRSRRSRTKGRGDFLVEW